MAAPQSLHDYIKKPDNFEKLYSGNTSFKEINHIIKCFVSISKYYDGLHRFLKIFSNTYQYIYSMLFPKCYVDNDRFGMQDKV